MEKNIHQRTFHFSLEVVQLVNLLPKNSAGFELGKQLFRSGTSIGANLVEGNGAVSRKEFINYIEIAKKSALETEYCLKLIAESKLVQDSTLPLLITEVQALQKILSTIVLRSKGSK